MAMSTGTAIALALAAASAGTQYYNTQQTAKRQDTQLAESLRSQGAKQREADALVADKVTEMQGSTAESDRRQALDSYIAALRKGKGNSEAGLAPLVGSDRFKADAAAAAEGVQNYGEKTAGLMARMDAPSMQRQREATGYGRLASDIGLIGRESRGQAFIDDLRLRAIRRNAGLDLLSGLLGAAGAAAGGLGGGAATAGGQLAYGTTGINSGIRTA